MTEKYNEELRQQLDNYRTEGRKRPMTMTALGEELGISATRVNKYLRLTADKKPEGNIQDLEDRVADLLKGASQRKVSDVEPFETNATKKLKATFELIRKTNDVALIAGPAGVGKSMAIRMYKDQHKTTLAINVPRWRRTDAGIVGQLWTAINPRDWDGQTPRATYMSDRLRNSNRLIIIDNSQRMTTGAREWVFDFHDETGCPIAMIGNPEVLQHIRRCDQHFSRVGIYQEVTLAAKQVPDYAKAMVDRLVDKPSGGLYDLATAVAEERGHLRALRKQLLLMRDLCETKTYQGDQIRAFHAAHAKLVRDYDL